MACTAQKPSAASPTTTQPLLEEQLYYLHMTPFATAHSAIQCIRRLRTFAKPTWHDRKLTAHLIILILIISLKINKKNTYYKYKYCYHHHQTFTYYLSDKKRYTNLYLISAHSFIQLGISDFIAKKILKKLQTMAIGVCERVAVGGNTNFGRRWCSILPWIVRLQPIDSHVCRRISFFAKMEKIGQTLLSVQNWLCALLHKDAIKSKLYGHAITGTIVIFNPNGLRSFIRMT